MTFQLQNITLANLVASKSNVRRTGKTERVDELAASITAHGLLQNLTVKPTTKGKFEVIAGGRRLAALKLLAKRKAWDAPVPCQVMDGDNVTEISLAENALQAPMHPADQFEAFASLNDGGMSVEDIAARFGVSPQIVMQRLKLGAVSPKLMTLYRDGEMNLEQLSAFAITDDHARQEEVWEELGFDRSRHAILEALGEGQVSSDDRRVLFVGIEAYKAAGGLLLRDLFDEEGGGFLTDAVLLNRLVTEKLAAESRRVTAEGWKWVRVEPEFDYGLASGMRRIHPAYRELTVEEKAEIQALNDRFVKLQQAGGEDISISDDETLSEIDAEIDAIRGKEVYAAEEQARAGAFVSLGRHGEVRVERGFVLVEDEAGDADEAKGGQTADNAAPDAKLKQGLPDGLMADLTARRTVALANELAQRPDLALAAVVHALSLQLFHHGAGAVSCFGLTPRRTYLVSFASDIEDGRAAMEVEQRHDGWKRELPDDPAALWDFVVALPIERQMSLLAHCTSLTVDAVSNSKMAGKARAVGHADALAVATSLDMTRYWQPTAEGFFGRLTKPQILEAVREATSPEQAQSCEAMKKPEMAARAEKLVGDTGWLPAPLR